MITLPAAVCAALDKLNASDTDGLDLRDIEAVSKLLPKSAGAWIKSHPVAYSRAFYEGYEPLEKREGGCSHEWISAEPDLAHRVKGCDCQELSIRERTCEICERHERRCNTCAGYEARDAV